MPELENKNGNKKTKNPKLNPLINEIKYFLRDLYMTFKPIYKFRGTNIKRAFIINAFFGLVPKKSTEFTFFLHK